MDLGAFQNHKTFKFPRTALSTKVWKVQLVVTYDLSWRKERVNLSTIEWNISQLLN